MTVFHVTAILLPLLLGNCLLKMGPFLSLWGSCWPPSQDRDQRQPSWKEALGRGSHNMWPLLPSKEGLGEGVGRVGVGMGAGSEQSRHSINQTEYEHFSVQLEPKVNQMGFSHCPCQGRKWRDNLRESPSPPLASPEKRHLFNRGRTNCFPPLQHHLWLGGETAAWNLDPQSLGFGLR